MRLAGLLAGALAVSGAGMATASPSHAPRELNASQLLAGGVVATDCTGAVGNPNPKTDLVAWEARDRQNELCSTQRLTDELANPAFVAMSAMEVAGSNPNEIFGDVTDPRLRSWGSVFVAGGDPFRVPTRWVALGRGQFQQFHYISTDGAEIDAELFSPNPHPGRRYPIVTFTPGLQESKEQAWWYGEGLAEAGYVVLIMDPQAQGDSEVTSHDTDPSKKCGIVCNVPTNDKPETHAAIDFAVSTPRHPDKYDVGRNGEHALPYNPLWQEVNRSEVGIAGHSLGASAVTPIGQQDPRVKAVISYDNIDLSLPSWLLPKIHAPALYFGTDYKFPEFATPRLPGAFENPEQHWPAFDQMRKAGVDSMVITPRASTHYEWDQQSSVGALPASRYGQLVSLYYSQAWFDYYLKHEQSGLRRLTALRFDGSADAHSIGGGTYSPAAAAKDPTNLVSGNVPYRIDGRCVADLLSFYNASAYWLDHGRVQSMNMRNRGCEERPAAAG
ncbi:MAG TPA: alpha/beta hydrolase [Mycobacteriales bacterium]|nr:alpha/beta hydrolase [Mycobacteriales bacterium]